MNIAGSIWRMKVHHSKVLFFSKDLAKKVKIIELEQIVVVFDFASFASVILRFHLDANADSAGRATISGHGGANVFIQSNTLCRLFY
jgi:hypothetical protein